MSPQEKADMQFLYTELHIIEHDQDHKKRDEIGKRYKLLSPFDRRRK